MLKIKQINYFIPILIGSIGLTGVFQLNEKISLPLLAFTVFFFLSLPKIKFYIEDVLILVMLIGMLFFTNTNITQSGFLYIFSFTFVIYLYSKSANVLIRDYNVFQVLYKFSFIANIFICYEFIARNFFPGLFIDLPRARVPEIEATFLGLFKRARGFAEEPAHMGLFYEFIFPLLFIYVLPQKRKIEKILFYSSTSLALICIFSSFTFAVILAYLGGCFLFKLNLKAKLITIGTFLFISISLLTLVPSVQDYTLSGIDAVFMKISFDPNNPSANDRSDRLISVIDLISSNYWGVGAMNLDSYTNYDSSLNLFLDILVFFGPITLVVFVFYLLIIAFKAFRIGKWSYFSSLILVLLHFCIISNFWYPYLWFIIGIVQYEYSNRKIKLT